MIILVKFVLDSHYTLVLSLDIMDISGETQRDVSHNIYKTRLDDKAVPVQATIGRDSQSELEKMKQQKGPDYCGSCYGGQEPESGCCNTCEEVRQAYVNRGWSFSNPDSIDQVCTDYHFHGRADRVLFSSPSVC
jgi:endoplasmic reticulum-Golgi intermediate compartment protein 3